jgi:hypothetical protein
MLPLEQPLTLLFFLLQLQLLVLLPCYCCPHAAAALVVAVAVNKSCFCCGAPTILDVTVEAAVYPAFLLRP